MENKKTRLVTIDYDEYLELLYYKEILEGSARYREIKSDPLSFEVGKIELFRSNYENRQREG